MKFRWTIQELARGTDAWILRGIVLERRSELNPQAPLYRRLTALYEKLDAQVQSEGRGF